MTIKYGLRPGAAPTQTGRFIPIIPQETSISFDLLVSEVAQRAATSEGIVANVMSAYHDIVKQHILNGNTVFIGDICRVFPTMTGVFDSADATIRDSSHLTVSVNVAKPFLKEIRQAARLEKVLVPTYREPQIISVKDMVTGLSNVFSPGGIVRLIGEELDFDVDSEDEGVFLSYSDPERSVIRVANYGRSGNKWVEFTIGRDLFTPSGNPSIYPSGLRLTLKTTYGNKSGTVRERQYENSLYRAPIFGGVWLEQVTPEARTGLGRLKITRDGTGPKVKLSYLEPGAYPDYGEALTIDLGVNQTYTLLGHVPETDSLLIYVDAEAFYASTEVQSVLSSGYMVETVQDFY